MYYVYMIKNSEDKLYIGLTKNPKQRLSEHSSKRGAQYTKSKLLFKICFLEEYNTLSLARKREIQLKKWRRDKKEELIKKYKQGLPTNIDVS